MKMIISAILLIISTIHLQAQRLPTDYVIPLLGQFKSG